MSAFFDDSVSVSGTRKTGGTVFAVRGTFAAKMVDDGFWNPGGEVTNTTVRQRTYFIRRDDWCDVEPPRVGYFFTDPEGVRFRVDSVADLPILGWNCGCREVR